eukprot:7379892-Prymnesium_polylepis.1
MPRSSARARARRNGGATGAIGGWGWGRGGRCGRQRRGSGHRAHATIVFSFGLARVCARHAPDNRVCARLFVEGKGEEDDQ